MRKVLLTLLMMSMIIVSPVNSVARAAVSNTDYAYQVVEALGIMDTDGKTEYKPDDTVTRGDFAQMLVNMTTYKDTVSAVSDFRLFNDVTSKYKGSGYIEFAVKQNLMSGYIDGNFKPKKNITLQEAVNAILVLLGYTDSDFTNNSNASRMALYSSKNLDDNIKKTAKQSLNRSDCANLFYNTLKTVMKNGTVYATTLGYKISTDGELDYMNVVNVEMKGPFIADINWASKLPFSISEAAFYRNDSVSGPNAIQNYDVLYYSENLKTVWAYSDKVTGILKKVSPNRLNPAAVTLAGNTYDIGTKEMTYRFSTLGDLDIGDAITILLGKDDTIVGVYTAEEYSTTVDGVVLNTTEDVTTGADDKLYKSAYATILDAYGRELTVEYNGEADDYIENDVVEVSYSGDGIKIVSIANKQLSDPVTGTVNDSGTKIGSTPIAKDVNIIDVKNKEYTNVVASRLAGVQLYQSDILYYDFNDNSEIDELILDDVTGDLGDYGILLDFDVNFVMNQETATYKYIIDGEEKSSSTAEFTETMIESPCRFSFHDGVLDDIMKLTRVYATSIDGLEVKAGSNSYIMSDEVEVYYWNNKKYYKTTLASVNDIEKYNLYAYYDRPMSVGGRVRVIVAQDK